MAHILGSSRAPTGKRSLIAPWLGMVTDSSSLRVGIPDTSRSPDARHNEHFWSLRFDGRTTKGWQPNRTAGPQPQVCLQSCRTPASIGCTTTKWQLRRAASPSQQVMFVVTPQGVLFLMPLRAHYKQGAIPKPRTFSATILSYTGFDVSVKIFWRRVAPPNLFDGAVSIEPVHSKPHGQTSLPVPPSRMP